VTVPVSAEDPQTKTSAFAPFAHQAYALLWTATLLSNIGTWMHDVSAAWLMTSLSPSPFIVSMVQAATTGAMALFALPAGAMADLFDRRTLLIGLKATSGALAATLAVLTYFQLIDAIGLLLITFLMGVCAALAAPVWQSIVPSLVPRDVLTHALAMNAMGINVARAIGPAIGGAIIVGFGAAAAFAVNGLSELVIIAALLMWRPAVATPKRTPEGFMAAMIGGLRYATASDLLKPVLVRAAAFFLFASAFWSLLPLVARTLLNGGAELYGLMVSAVGAGAVLGALSLPWIKRRLGSGHHMVFSGSLALSVILVGLASIRLPSVAVALCFTTGVAWIMVLSSLNIAAQNALPDWVRGRGLSIFGLVFFGSMTIGAMSWGTLAAIYGLPIALVAAGLGVAAGAAVTRGFVLDDGRLDLSPSGHWPEPPNAATVDDARGPVLVMIEYRIVPEHRDAFVSALTRLKVERYRDGAYAWSVYENIADPGRFVETFEEATWADHMRHHARVTKADADIQAEVAKLHLGPVPPKVTHLVRS
jgi:MFS family permease